MRTKLRQNIEKKRKFSFNAYHVKSDNQDFNNHILNSGLYQKIQDKTFLSHFTIRSGILHVGHSMNVNSYHASFVASYLAEKLFITRQSFAFETVMSHVSKVELLRSAHKAGYKTYLYFIFTDSIETNIARVQLRMLAGEHSVKEETIKSRAPRTFSLLPEAFNIADSAYVIDNSDKEKIVLKKENNVLYKSPVVPQIANTSVKKIIRGFKGKISA